MSKSHSLLSPSGASRWVACPGSVNLCRDIESKTSSYAEEGTAAHEMAEIALQKGVDLKSLVGQQSKDAPEYKFSDVMAGYLFSYVDRCRELMEKADFIWVEEKFTILEEFDVKGTSDFTCVYGNTLHIVDLKYGQGVSVGAKDNMQLMLYAWGAYQLVCGDALGIEWVVLEISQPRKESFPQHVISVTELFEFIENIKKSAERALDPNCSEFEIGKWCTFCDGKLKCPKMREKAQNLAVQVFDEIKDSPMEEVAEILDIASAIRGYLDAVEKYALEQALAGVVIPNYKVVEGRKGNEKWNDEEMLPMVLPLDEEMLYEKKLISPAQAKKLLPKGFDLSSVTSRTEGKPTLVESSDKRKSII